MVVSPIEKLNNWKQSGGKIAIYCAGAHGKSFKRLFDYLGIKVDLFLDNDVNKKGTIVEGIKCVSPTEISSNNGFVTVICTRIDYYADVYRTAIAQKISHIIDFRVLLDDLIENRTELFLKLIDTRYYESSADIFYSNIDGSIIEIEENERKCCDRVAVYTGLFGNYDNLYEPLSEPDNVDYYFVADKKPEINTKYTWIDSTTIIPAEITTPIKRNRYIKMHPHLFFQKYKYSIYIDANIQIVDDVSKLIFDMPYGIAVPNHWRRDCLYYEAMTVANYKRVVPKDVIQQVRRYISEGFPLHYGLTEMCVIVREHNNPKCIDVMNTWWHEFDNESQRDQLSFPYALWQNDILVKDVAMLGNNIRENHMFSFYAHCINSENVHNTKKI